MPEPGIDQSREREPASSAPDRLMFVRHGDYHNPYVDPAAPGYDHEKRGQLNERGLEQAGDFAESLFDEAKDKAVDILILNSPTPVIDDNGAKQGRRAENTALEIGTRLRQLKADDPLSKICLLGGAAEVGDGPVAPLYDQRTQEPQTHYIATADDPTAYIDAMEAKYGRGGRKEAYHVGDPELDPVAREIGAETAQDVADRTLEFMRDCQKLQELHRQVSPDRQLIIIAATHDDNLREVLQRNFGLGEEIHGQFAKNLESVDIEMADDGSLKTEWGGETYAIPA